LAPDWSDIYLHQSTEAMLAASLGNRTGTSRILEGELAAGAWLGHGGGLDVVVAKREAVAGCVVVSSRCLSRSIAIAAVADGAENARQGGVVILAPVR
jgi:hypothetical protein